MKTVTIYTDASLCQKSHVGGWAAWVRYGSEPSFMLGGVFKDLISSSTEAELKAIANAVWIISKRFGLDDCRVIVVTDSLQALEFVNGRQPPKNNNGHRFKADSHAKKNQIFTARNKIAQQIHAMIPKGSTIKANKVKAHDKSDGKRSYVNDRVDKACRSHMRLARESLLKTGPNHFYDTLSVK